VNVKKGCKRSLLTTCYSPQTFVRSTFRTNRKKSFFELSFEVNEGLPGREDLILKYGNLIAVFDVKEVSKSSAENMPLNYLKFEIMPKGILVVNAFATYLFTSEQKIHFLIKCSIIQNLETIV